MSIKKKTKKVTRKRKNPDWSFTDFFTSKLKRKRDSNSLSVTDGDIILTGKNLPENYQTIVRILEEELKDLKIEFQPNGSKKIYVLNRLHDPKEAREKINMSEYGMMRRPRG